MIETNGFDPYFAIKQVGGYLNLCSKDKNSVSGRGGKLRVARAGHN